MNRLQMAASTLPPEPCPATPGPSAQVGVDGVEGAAAGTELRGIQIPQGPVDRALDLVEIRAVGLNVDQTGEDIPLGLEALDRLDGLVAIPGVVAVVLLVEVDHGAVVEGDFLAEAGGVVGGDLLTHGHEVHGAGGGQ